MLTVEDEGTAASDFNIYGTYVLFGKIPAFNNGAIATVFANGLVRADENTGSEYFASSINVSFKTGAIFEWNNYNVFNTQQVIYFPNAISEVPIFRISKTTPALGSTKDNTFNGILEINSNVAFTGTGDKIFRDGLTGIGILKVASSTARYFITSSTGIIGGTLKIETNNILRFPNGILIPNGSNVSVTGTGSLKNDGGNFKIDGILDISDVKLTLTIGSLILNGTIKTSKNTGFFNPGNISSGVIKINDASTIEYNGADQDITSSTVLKSSYYNIVFSGTGKKIPISGIDVHTNGSVKITGQAIVDASAKNIGSSGLDATSFIMDGGRLILGTSSNEALPLMDGPYNITGGVIEYNYSGTTITQTIKTKTYQNIEVTGSNVGNSSGNITLNSGGTFTVKSNGVFEINANSITSPSGGATVTVETGGFFKTGNNQGFHGFATTPDLQYSSIHSNISDIRLMPGSTIEYMRKGDQPITTANELIYSNIFLSGSGNKVAPKGDLKILGNIVKSGTSIFDANNGSVILNGTSDQSISGGMMLFNNFTNINMTGLNINNDIGVYKSLLLGLNSTTILNTGDIHLKSDNYNTANVAQVPASSKIKYNAGRFIVERYIPKHSKAWQLLSAPAKGETIKNTWQESNNPGGNIKPGYGTQITSNIPDATNLGFDLNSIGPSMKTYNSLTNQWDGVANTKDLLINNLSGYMIFIRGDRSVTDVNQAAVATTLRTRGKLYSPGNEAPLPVNTIANTFASIGNPYASAINFENINLSEGIDHSYYIWDPELNTSGFSAYGFGGYRTISGNSVVPATGKFSDENNLPMIQSGQAFLIHSSKSGTVIFDESCKIPGSTSIFRATGLVKPNAQLRANLLVLNSNESILLDGILTQFHTDYLNELDKWDAFKITNSNENMAISTQGNSIAIERRQRPEINDTIFYHLEHLLKKPYRIEFIANNLEKYGIELFLEDKYLQTKSQLNPTGITNIDFSVNSIAGSFDKERFQVIFKAAGGPLPITFHSLNVFLKSNNIMVEWSVENEMNIDHYEVEKSSDGNLFFSVNSQFSKNISASNYDWLDEKPFEGYNYYRIKSVGKNGKVEYSAIVPVNAGIKKSSIVVYNNPLINGKIALQFVSQPFGKYLVKLFTTSGQRVLSKEINHNGGSRSEIISLPHNAAHGIYLLKITKPSGKMVIIKIIK